MVLGLMFRWVVSWWMEFSCVLGGSCEFWIKVCRCCLIWLVSGVGELWFSENISVIVVG